MQGKTVVITGASSGIGKQTALELLRQGARVVMACRERSRAEAARADLEAGAGAKGRVEIRDLDLASLDSVREFADEAASGLERIDVLINNAGLFPPKLRTTAEGFEAQFGVNYLGHYLLTRLLEEKLRASSPSRVVHLTSMLHARGDLDFDNLRGEKPYKAQPLYNQSKLANLLFSNELARRLDGTGVTSNAVHPGAIATDIVRDNAWLVRKIVGLVFKSVEHGAKGPTKLASDPTLETTSGRYFFETEEKEPSEKARDPQLAARLWDFSAEACGVTK